MVGPGTGLAPFRSFILERHLSGQSCGEMVLYFGCRRSDQDYLYGEQLEQWGREGVITLQTAFSRQQAKKVRAAAFRVTPAALYLHPVPLD